MKLIPFKTKPEFAHKYSEKYTLLERVLMRPLPLPSRHFYNNFSTEQTIQGGITQKALKALPAGIHVIHGSSTMKGAIKREIQDVFGKVVASAGRPYRKGFISLKAKRKP